jgi:hypothetical protein
VFALLAIGLMLLLIEGLAGMLVVGHTAWEVVQPFDERVHTRYDANLGWVSIPNFSRPEMYGWGKGLTTDARGFRGAVSLPDAIAPGRVRVICSGDSFTFGVGVGDAETWCHRLTALDSRLESINMGQIGYGLDQAFLWYERDGAKLPHHVQVLAVVSADFDRMRSSTFMSYGKPVLAVDGDELTVRNTPVPNRSTTAVRFQRIAWALSTSRTAQVVRALVARPSPPTQVPGAADKLRPVVERLLRGLRERHRQQGTALVVAFLPVRTDYDDSRSDPWRRMLREAAADQIPVVDLVEEFRGLPRSDVDALFIHGGESGYDLAEGHYSSLGHDFVARSILRAISGLNVAPR